MKETSGPAGFRTPFKDAFRRTFHRGLGAWPTALLLVLIVVLALPAGWLLAPAFLGPVPVTAPETPAWQQAPASLSARQGLSPLTDSAPVPLPASVAAQLDPVLKPDGGGTFTGLVQDAFTGQVLFDRGGSENRIPASNMKLLTAVAALRVLGPDARFSTRVITGPTPDQVVLAAGGDVLLAAGESAPDEVLGHAGLATLAAATVAALQDAGATGELKVLVDDSLFSGPALNPAGQAGTSKPAKWPRCSRWH